MEGLAIVVFAIVILAVVIVALGGIGNGSSPKPARPSRPRTTRLDRAVTRIAALDLEPVRQKLRSKLGWTDDRIAAAEAEYRDFLTLLARHPGETVVPWSEDLDEMWHYHILDTRKYAADCQAIFGRFINHNPHLAKGTDPHRVASRRTHERLAALRTERTRRNEPATDRSADAAAVASCGAAVACGVTGGASLSDIGGGDGGGGGGDGGGGASCGGASCGGASCGGASCGGGGCGGGCGGG